MTKNDSKFRSSTDRETSGGGATENDTAIPPSADLAGRYRYVVNTAPLETIERATAEMLADLPPADGERIRDRLDQFTELHGGEPKEAFQAAGALLARLGAQAEKRRPGALERAVRGGVSARVGEELSSVLARAFVATPTASAFLTRLEEAADPGHTPPTEPESDPDFSDEFGYVSGYEGRCGFENVEFDRWT